MTSLQYFNIIFEFWSAIFCALTAICVAVTMKYDKTEAKIVMGLLISNMFLNISEALAYVYRGNTTQVGYYAVRITNFLVFLNNMVMLFFVVSFVCHLIKKNGGRDSRIEKRIAYVLITVSIMLLILSRFFGFYYTFDTQNRYSRLGSYWIMVVLSQMVIAIVMFITFRNWKHLKNVERIELLMLEFFPILGLIIQLFTYGISVSTIVNTISIFLIFLTYEMGYSDFMIAKERSFLNQVIYAFVQAIDEKDPYTAGHSFRVARYSGMIARKMDLNNDVVDDIYQMALLHDVGKIGISLDILSKQGPLTDEEYGTIKTHPGLGGEILGKIKDKPELLIGARWHHERYDGKGYPDGLAGEDIPYQARIIAMADSYDAMTSNRSYRSYLSQNKVRSEIEKNAGTQFDPQIAKIMIELIDEDVKYILREED